MFRRDGQVTLAPAGLTAARRTAAILLLLAGLALLALPVFTAAAQDTGGAPVVRVINLDLEIDIVSSRFLRGAIADANNDNVELIVIRIDTPGGRLDSTREMVSAILESRVPVVAFVAPEGVQAASAGTFIAASAGLLAMAPALMVVPPRLQAMHALWLSIMAVMVAAPAQLCLTATATAARASEAVAIC